MSQAPFSNGTESRGCILCKFGMIGTVTRAFANVRAARESLTTLLALFMPRPARITFVSSSTR